MKITRIDIDAYSSDRYNEGPKIDEWIGVVVHRGTLHENKPIWYPRRMAHTVTRASLLRCQRAQLALLERKP